MKNKRKLIRWKQNIRASFVSLSRMA